MTVFIIIAALLVVITIALLFFPLLKKQPDDKPEADSSELSMQVLREQLQEVEQAQANGQIDAVSAEKEKRELERRALEDHATGEPLAQANPGVQRKFIIAAAVIIPLMAAGLYWMLGNPDTLKPGGTTQAPADHAGANHSLNPEQIASMAEKLSERLASNPADGEGWLMLGRSYAAIGRHAEAAAAFGRAVSLLPPNPNYLADYADVLAMAQGRRLSGEPEKIIAQALSLDPNHIKALALSGSTAFEKGDFQRAASEWQKILMLVPAESNIAQGIRNSIADAQSRLGQAGSVAAQPSSQSAPGNASISGSVTISDKIKGSLSPNDTVFIFARPTEGPRMPLALRRMTVSQLPSDFTLDDSMAMTPSAKLSGAKQVVIGARITKTGSATPQPGDYEGLTQPVAVGSKNIKLVIDTPVK